MNIPGRVSWQRSWMSPADNWKRTIRGLSLLRLDLAEEGEEKKRPRCCFGPILGKSCQSCFDGQTGFNEIKNRANQMSFTLVARRQKREAAYFRLPPPPHTQCKGTCFISFNFHFDIYPRREGKKKQSDALEQANQHFSFKSLFQPPTSSQFPLKKTQKPNLL